MEAIDQKIATLIDRTEKFQEIPQYEGLSLVDRTTALAALYSADVLQSISDQTLRQADALELIGDRLKISERQADALERQADALERVAIAFEKFALCVNPIKNEFVIERP